MKNRNRKDTVKEYYLHNLHIAVLDRVQQIAVSHGFGDVLVTTDDFTYDYKTWRQEMGERQRSLRISFKSDGYGDISGWYRNGVFEIRASSEKTVTDDAIHEIDAFLAQKERRWKRLFLGNSPFVFIGALVIMGSGAWLYSISRAYGLSVSIVTLVFLLSSAWYEYSPKVLFTNPSDENFWTRRKDEIIVAIVVAIVVQALNTLYSIIWK